MDFAFGLIEVSGDFLIFWMFLKNFNYFKRLKAAKLQQDGHHFTLKDKVMILWVYMIVAMNLLNSLCRILFQPLVINTFLKDDEHTKLTYREIDTIGTDLFIPICDFLTLLSFLYMFS